MIYRHVKIESCAMALPDEAVTSVELEERLAPLYRRLKLPEGRLEIMTGIRERRVWPPGFKPSQASAAAGRAAIDKAGIDPAVIGCLIHCAVSRDYAEPATSTAVHRALGLADTALNFDISNACLGVLTGMMAVGNMIELGQIDCGLVVAGESSRPLMESTIRELNENTALTRRDIKPVFASLTIGSAAAAVLLTRAASESDSGRLLGGASLCNTAFNHLCQEDGGTGKNGSDHVLMKTDSEELLVRGVEVARAAWREAKNELGWCNETPDRVCTHQVGRIHRQRLYEALGLSAELDVSTVEFMGNCGSASLPATMAHAEATGQLKKGDRLALLGIGSGINCTMLGVEW